MDLMNDTCLLCHNDAIYVLGMQRMVQKVKIMHENRAGNFDCT